MRQARLQKILSGLTSLNVFDLGGRKLGMDDPDLGNWSYAYDALGNLTRQADARGQRVCLYYDALNRLSGKHYRLDDACPTSPPGSLDVAYAYDDESSQYGIGYRTGMVDDSGSTSWRCDTRGRVSQETKAITGSGSFTAQWTYNSADLLESLTYPDGEMLTYTYHPQLALNSLMSNRDTNNQANNYYILQHTAYDAAGRSVRQWLGAANLAQNSTVVKVNTYNAWNTQGGRLQRTNAGLYNTPASVLDQSYTYDAVGNIVSLVDAQNSGQKQCFGYDAMDRLTSARVGDVNCNGSLGNGEYADEGYTYDAITGNLSSKTGMGSYLYGDTAHKHAVTATGSGWAYQYDFNGNMTRRDPPGSDVYDYAYDPENRLHQVEKNEVGLAEFTYDGEGARVQAEVNSTVTYFFGGIYESTGGVITKYYTASGVRLALRVGGDMTYLFGDHLGSTSATYRVSDATTTRQLYKPWGEPRYASSSLPTPYTYTGQYHYTDDITTPGVTEGFGLMFYNARWYDPALSRFTQPDSIIPDPYNSLDWNRYQYVRENPLKYTDTTGHFPWLLIPILIFIATIPGDTGPYEVDPTTAAVGDAALRFVDQVDWIYTGVDCLSGHCGGTDILFGILPFVNGGMDDAADAARALDNAAEQAGESIIRAINPPSYRGGLKGAMERLGNNAPMGMLNPQVHHNLPWDFRDWFAGPGRGLDVNDPQFGRWVSGSPQGPHQRWTYEYAQAWRSFIRNNPNASRQQVFDYLKELLDSGRYPSH